MDFSSAQQQENIMGFTNQQEDKKPRPPQEQALNCPRCDSTNTKFCYYNNYSLSQPRYFCKSCRRYWTKGGTLRNVPVGGGCRKNKRSSSSASSSAVSSPISKSRTQDQVFINNPLRQTLPPMSYGSNDLGLAFSRLQKQQISNGPTLGFNENNDLSFLGNPSTTHLDQVLRNPSLNTCNGGPDGLKNGFFGNWQNFYYGCENGAMGCGVGVGGGQEMDNNTIGVGPVCVSGEMNFLPFENSKTSTMKQGLVNRESCENPNKALWGFPWQQIHNNGEGSLVNGDLDLGRANWTNHGISSSMHGLINSPLM